VLADRLAILNDGLIVSEGTLDEIVATSGDVTTIRFRLNDGAVPPDGIPAMTRLDDGSLELRTKDPVGVLNRLTGWALNGGVTLADLSATRASLEDTYLQLTGQAAERGGGNG
jgi:ABC-2 type transport system ATP-binding protein